MQNKWGFTLGSRLLRLGCPSPHPPLSFQINKRAGAMSALQLSLAARLSLLIKITYLPARRGANHPVLAPAQPWALCPPFSPGAKKQSPWTSPLSTRMARPIRRPATVNYILHHEAAGSASESGCLQAPLLNFGALLGVDRNPMCEYPGHWLRDWFHCRFSADPACLSWRWTVGGLAGSLVAVFRLLKQPFDFTLASDRGAALQLWLCRWLLLSLKHFHFT